MLEDACGALDVILADTDIEIDVPASKDELSGSRPDAEAARLDSESNTADIVAADGGGGVNECMPTGSVGVSSGKSSSSLCKPMGFKGRRKVPLLGAGLKPIESQMMLYSSIFSA